MQSKIAEALCLLTLSGQTVLHRQGWLMMSVADLGPLQTDLCSVVQVVPSNTCQICFCLHIEKFKQDSLVSICPCCHLQFWVRQIQTAFASSSTFCFLWSLRHLTQAQETVLAYQALDGDAPALSVKVHQVSSD